jgi:hypothetical protein
MAGEGSESVKEQDGVSSTIARSKPIRLDVPSIDLGRIVDNGNHVLRAFRLHNVADYEVWSLLFMSL